MLALGITAIVFGIIEYYQHREYDLNHPDYEKIHSGVIGYALIAIAAIIKSL